jgi:phage terminase large subunit
MNDPVYFVREILGAVPEDYQADILNSAVSEPYTAAHCGHGVGKTTTGSWLLIWFLFTRAESKVITTAPTWRQVKDLLWPEVHHWMHRAELEKMGWVWPYRLLDTRLEISQEWYATGEASDDPQKLEGYHAPAILYIVDEAKGVPDSHFNSMDGGMTTPEARMVLLSTPGDTTGKFYRVCTGKENSDPDDEEPMYWKVIHVNGENSNRVSKRWIETRKQAWGADSALYRIRVKGEFVDTTTDTLIPAGQFEAAIGRELPVIAKSRPVKVMAVDVARYGSDRSVVAWREGNTIKGFRKFDRQSLESTASMVYDMGKELTPDVILIDEVGVGAGVLDNLQSRRRRLTRSKVFGFNGARKPSEEDDEVPLFYNRRAEVYWRLRELFGKGLISVPEDELLGQQLTDLRYEYVTRGQHTVIKIESKEDMRRKGKMSPNEADAVMMLFAEDEIAVSMGIGVWL